MPVPFSLLRDRNAKPKEEHPRHLHPPDGPFARAFAIRDWGAVAAPEIVRALQAIPGAAQVRVVLHACPARIAWDWKMRYKRRRLEASLADAEQFVSREELGALEAIHRLYESSALEGARLFDLWLLVAIEAATEQDLDHATARLREKLEVLGLRADEMRFAQRPAWAAAEPAAFFDRDELARLGVRGRLADEAPAAAFYPFTSGALGDSTGVYLGNRAADGGFVYLNLGDPQDENSQNMVVVGANGQGKSTFLKALVVGLLLEGFRVFVLDVDGEYRALCEAAGGLWVDHTPASGRYFDPVPIPPPIGADHPLATAEDGARFQSAAEAVARTVALLAGGELGPDEANAVDRAIGAAHARKGIHARDPRTWDRVDQPAIHDWYAALKEDPTPGARRLAERLWRFFEGMQAHLFRRAEGRVAENRLVVFHVAQIANSEVEARLGDVKMSLATSWIWNEIKRERFRGERFTAVVLDEFQRLALNDRASRFTNTVATTIRKWNGMLVAATNKPSVLWETVGGAGVWDNTPFKVLFWMEDSAIRALSERLDVPEEAVEALRTFHGTKRFLLRARDRGWDALKLELPPEELAMYRTRGLRAAAREEA